jgi:hypothetical protein
VLVRASLVCVFKQNRKFTDWLFVCFSLVNFVIATHNF